MAQREYKINLQHTEFPMLTEFQTRTVLAPGKEEISNRDDLPSIAYCHNVMPTRQGYTSIGYQEFVPAITGLAVGEELLTTRRVYSSNLNDLEYLAWTSAGNVYLLDTALPNFPVWELLPATTPAAPMESDDITVGTVNAVSYIFYDKAGAFTFDSITKLLSPVALTGINIPTTLGLTASSGYLIAYTRLDVAWSSTIDPTDFVPSEITGAGGASVADIEGRIRFCLPNSLGILIYAANNIVAATFTGNSKFPFKFRPVDDSKGGTSLDLISSDNNSKLHYAFTKAGLQAVTSSGAETIFPQVTDFLEGQRFEDYIEETDEFFIFDTTATTPALVKYIASRYLVISYGEFFGTDSAASSHALVLDTSLNKLGKLKIAHTDVFEYPEVGGSDARKNLAFLAPDGTTSLVRFSLLEQSSGVLMLGKLQATRARNITLLKVEVENIDSDAMLSVIDKPSASGKVLDANIAGTLVASEDGLRTYAFKASAKNHNLMFKGQFNLTTAQVLYTIGGRR